MIYTVTDWLTARLFEYIHSMKMFRLKQFYTIYSKYVIKHSKLLLYLRKSFTDLPISIYICFRLLLSSVYCNPSYWKARTEGWLEAERSLPSWLVDFPTFERVNWGVAGCITSVGGVQRNNSYFYLHLILGYRGLPVHPARVAGVGQGHLGVAHAHVPVVVVGVHHGIFSAIQSYNSRGVGWKQSSISTPKPWFLLTQEGHPPVHQPSLFLSIILSFVIQCLTYSTVYRLLLLYSIFVVEINK